MKESQVWGYFVSWQCDLQGPTLYAVGVMVMVMWALGMSLSHDSVICATFALGFGYIIRVGLHN